jgi:decaprenyl-phosphate phosphoribosyltransferase
MAASLSQFVRLARPKQWAKGVFVLLGPLYGAADGHHVAWWAVGLTIVAFAVASSACYIVNDIRDVDADRAHPRKKHRPIASGAVGVGAGVVLAASLWAASAWAAVAAWRLGDGGASIGPRGVWVVSCVAVYVANVLFYSAWFKHVVILDVVSLAMGFVLRVLAGCAAAGVEPSTWLLNVTLFAAMFLGFAKRLGERNTLEQAGGDSVMARRVQADYTREILRLAVGLTAVATLVTYAGYVQARAERFTFHAGEWGFNLLWLTVPPAVLALLRCVVLVEKGAYDDPTELAWGDWGLKGALAAFGVVTGVSILLV